MALTSMTAADALPEFAHTVERSPPWAWHEHANDEGAEAVLFSMQDTPVFEALGLYREEPYTEHGGHQPIARVFEG